MFLYTILTKTLSENVVLRQMSGFVILFHDSQYVMNVTESKKNKITNLTWLFRKKVSPTN